MPSIRRTWRRCRFGTEPRGARHAQQLLDAHRRVRRSARHYARRAAGRVLAARHRCARVLYPLSQTELFGTSEATGRHNAPNSYAIAERAINLPSYHDMSSENIATVCNVVLDLVKAHQETLTCLAS
ncbi:DegT/DnrJ/EryC1/StrS family aminotransferase [Ralstonia sp. 1B3]|uniref:DegT/DnrJ/EryC1/StrS family aminotransferase n=1 Tax=Ralstonia sp. 1B3 TaxID=2997421 RepID=UPI002FC9B457